MKYAFAAILAVGIVHVAKSEDAVVIAEKKYNAVIEQAKKDLVTVLKAEMTRLTKAGDLDGALKIRDRLSALDKQTGSSPSTATATKTINLLTIKFKEVCGHWTLSNNSLTSDQEKNARVEFAYEPPEEYDFRMTFVREDGADDIVQILSKNQQAFVWMLDAGRSSIAGFDLIDGKGAGSNNASGKAVVKNGIDCTCVIEVRRDSLKAVVNDKVVAQIKTEGRAFTINSSWKLGNNRAIGIGTYGSKTVFKALELVEVSGSGKTLEQ